MATYSTKDIHQLLLDLCGERLTKHRAPGRSRRAYRDAWEARELIHSSAVFGKLLGRHKGDLALVGAAEVLCMGLDEESGIESVTSETVPMPPALGDNPDATYSSEDVRRVLAGALEEDGHGRIPHGAWRDNWLSEAAEFVKRLGFSKSDLELVGAAESATIELARRDQERQDRAEQEDAAERARHVEAAERLWSESDTVTVAMLGRKLVPPLRSVEVNKLLARIGVQEKDSEMDGRSAACRSPRQTRRVPGGSSSGTPGRRTCSPSCRPSWSASMTRLSRRSSRRCGPVYGRILQIP